MRLLPCKTVYEQQGTVIAMVDVHEDISSRPMRRYRRM
jgi:hypothetical protein